MMRARSYQIAFFVAMLLHVSLVVSFLFERHHERPVLTLEAKNEPGQMQPNPVETPIQAVSVNNQEVMQTVNRLKQERLHQQKIEENRQKALAQQVESARKQRIAEQQRLEKLKIEAAQLAIARKKQMLEEQAHLKQLAQQKLEQEKRLAEMKQQAIQMQKQQEEAKKIAIQKAADLAKKKAQEQARAELAKAANEQAAKEKAQAQQALMDAAHAARMAGEVDKYKALIINAISQRWILPENVDNTLSSQFRIRLAPNGAVLEVSLTRSSGDPILDRSAQSAIYKASPLPVPQDSVLFNMFRDISLTVKPVNARG